MSDNRIGPETDAAGRRQSAVRDVTVARIGFGTPSGTRLSVMLPMEFGRGVCDVPTSEGTGWGAERFIVRILLGVSAVIWHLLLPACDASEPAVVANRLKMTALRESQGIVDRRDLLFDIRDGDANEEVWWHSGFVKADDQWRDPFSATSPDRSALLKEFANRSEHANSAQDHLKLAEWCEDSGLIRRSQFHLKRAMSIRPSLQKKGRLEQAGLVNVDGQWLTKSREQDLHRAFRSRQEAFDRWLRPVRAVAAKLSTSRRSREKAIQELSQITDPLAVPVVDHILQQLGDEGTRTAIDVLSRIGCYESSLVLAKYAVFHPTESIRLKAANALVGRRLEDFVPPLLKLLAGSVRADTSAIRDSRNIHMMSILSRETETQQQTLCVRAHFHLLPASWLYLVFDREGGRRAAEVQRQVSTIASEVALRMKPSAIDHVRNVERTVEQVNEQTRFLNKRVTAVLAVVGNGIATEDPAFWWKWWLQETDMSAAGKKTVYASAAKKHVMKVDLYPVIRVISCFAAGTEVCTDHGLVPIQKIRPGEQVLSQNIETGQLDYRAVLKTTVREPKRLMALKIGSDTIICTGGHPFWQSGKGWTKARDLKPSSLIHTATGNAVVSEVHKDNVRETFNLVVEDFGNYFVGREAVLVHDVTLPSPTNMVTPGFSEFALSESSDP